MTGIMQAVLGGSFGFPNGWPANIGDAYGGGYFAGQINVSGTKYNLVVAPVASGQTNNKSWSNTITTTGITSVINGPTNSASLAALGAAYQSAVFAEGLTIGGFSDWYMPAKNELEVLYYYLKPGTATNNTASGSNANAVSPESISTAYSAFVPSQTTKTSFKTGGAEAFAANIYWASTEISSARAATQTFDDGQQSDASKNTSNAITYVRAVRRVAA